MGSLSELLASPEANQAANLAIKKITEGVQTGNSELVYDGLCDYTVTCVAGGIYQQNPLAETRNAIQFAQDLEKVTIALSAGEPRIAASVMRNWANRWTNCDLATAPEVMLPRQVMPVAMAVNEAITGLDDSAHFISTRIFDRQRKTLAPFLYWSQAVIKDPQQPFSEKILFRNWGIQTFLPFRQVKAS